MLASYGGRLVIAYADITLSLRQHNGMMMTGYATSMRDLTPNGSTWHYTSPFDRLVQ